jgi:hypothetical protein
MKPLLILATIIVLAAGIGNARQTWVPNSTDTQGRIYAQDVTPNNMPDLAGPPQPAWVPDPSAGHYDCPDGWTEYSRSEPYPPTNNLYTLNDGPPLGFYETLDAKGHVLALRPAPGICIKDTK